MSLSSIEEEKKGELQRYPELQQQNDLNNQSLNLSYNIEPLKAPEQLQPNKYGITLKIAEHFTKGEDIRKHTVYIIKGTDNNGPIEISRRYSDFVLIREVLVLRWPGCYIPPLPPKGLLRKMETQFIEDRKIGLDLFLKKISDIFVLFHSQEFQLFLKFGRGDFAHEMKPLKQISFGEMVQRYASNFQHLSYIQTGDEAKVIVTRFKSFLGKMQEKFQSIRLLSREVAKAKRAFYNGMANFQMRIASEYEKNVIAEYDGPQEFNPIFTKEDNTVLDEKAKKLKSAAEKPTIETFDAWLNSEYRDLSAVMEAILQKERYDTLRTKAEGKVKSYTERLEKVGQMKFDWKNFLTLKSNDELKATLENNIVKYKEDIKNLELLENMIVLVLAYDGIQKFKASRSEIFYNLISKTISGEIENLNSVLDYWTTIQNNENGRPGGRKGGEQEPDLEKLLEGTD